jgi:hypothetical protein
MLVIAAIVDNPAPVLSLAIGLFGICGVIFTALKYNRDDSKAVVDQQNTILGDMKLLNDELRTTAASLREERDALRVQVGELTAQVQELRDAIT